MGNIFIWVGFVTALLATVSFFIGSNEKTRPVQLGRVFYQIAAIATLGSTAFLLYLILSHQFQYTYVWSNSSTDLPLNLLIATFYAGQEGSFHLWAFMTSVMGLFLMAYVSQKNKDGTGRYEPQVMGLYSLILTFLMFILIVKSPYLLVWESFPADVQFGFIPPEGRGLNPLLQNFWMSIHPPILFTGFTASSIPFCFAIAALMKNEYNRWLKLALPWTLLAAMILGFGIMLGGFWAYGVLGWGGYWGWDPVENSSLVPWILLIAAIHTMVGEQTTGKFKKTTLTLCILAYVLILYSTFLTRSGVLGDASVHSFVDPGQEVYLFLIVFLSLFGAGGIGMIFFRLKHLKAAKTETTNLLSRESALFVGAITLCATALVIAAGTSWPIIAKGTVDPDFYNKMNLPLAILIAFINGFSILLKWKHSTEKEFLKSLYVPLTLAGAATILLVIIGIRDFLIGIFAAGAMFAFFINAEIAYQIFLKNKVKAGAYIAHLGIMVLFLGIIGSSKYSREENVSLPINEQKEALGYKMTYTGATPIKGEEEKYHFNVIVEKENKKFLLQPVMYYSEYSEGVMKNPDIANLITKDVYLSPMSLEVPEEFTEQDVVKFKKNEEKEFRGLKIKFIDFDRTLFDPDSFQKGGENIMGAMLEVTLDGKKQTVVAQQKFASGVQENIAVKMPGNDKFIFYFAKMDLKAEPMVDIAIVDNTMPKDNMKKETLVLEASIKPFINLVWGGTIILVLGFFFSMLNRYKRVKNNV